MQIRIRHLRIRATLAKVICATACFALAAGSVPARADDHLPIFNVEPTIGYSTTADGVNAGGGPFNPGPLDGQITINGTVTLPIVKNLSLVYEKLQNGAFDSNLSSVAIGGHTVYPGGNRDILQNYRAEYRLGRFTVESGFASRYRECCPADFLEWHKGFFGVKYTTPRLAILHDGYFVFDLTGNAVKHFSSPAALAELRPGLSLPNNTEIFTTQQSIKVVVPISQRLGIRTSTTFLWGALDYPQNGPFPQYYDVFITTLTKQVTRDVGITATVANVKQRIQGYPFPAPNAIRTSAFTLAANFRVDLNRFLRAGSPDTGRPTLPGAAGNPQQVGAAASGLTSSLPAAAAASSAGSPAAPRTP
jgi:hypothetical protein